MNPTRLFLLRHAEVEARYQRVFGGRIDMDLSPRGHQQAAALAQYLRRQPLDALYASPMKRVQQTLAAFNGQGARPAILKTELREVDFGDWTGLTWEEVRTRHRVSAFDWLHHLEQGTVPNAEHGPAFRARVAPCVRQILRDHEGQSVGVACHGGVIRVILAILLDLPLPKMVGFEIDYASVTQVDSFPHRSEVQLLNFTPWRDLA